VPTARKHLIQRRGHSTLSRTTCAGRAKNLETFQGLPADSRNSIASCYRTRRVRFVVLCNYYSTHTTPLLSCLTFCDAPRCQESDFCGTSICGTIPYVLYMLGKSGLGISKSNSLKRVKLTKCACLVCACMHKFVHVTCTFQFCPIEGVLWGILYIQKQILC
jgi:hypothetical protein